VHTGLNYNHLFDSAFFNAEFGFKQVRDANNDNQITEGEYSFGNANNTNLLFASLSSWRGNKHYEMVNHLGNVLTVISDKKLAKCVSGTFIGYNAEVISATDYSPFGAPLAGRSFQSSEYRFGFNGKENDNEVKGVGNSIAFEARIYDSRLGKFLSVDPMIKDYPSFTSYSFAGNSPIVLVDKKGEFPWVTGLIGAGVNIAIGYIGAKVNNQEYSAKDALIDGVIGFAVGSGAALLAPVLGITTATTTGRIVQGALTGMGTGFTSNALDQGTRIAIGDQEEWSNSQFAFSGIGGLFGGSAAAGMGNAAEKFMSKVGDKMLGDFTKGELKQYINYQTKFLKSRIEQQTGAKVGKRQLQREVEKVAGEWKDIKVSEINFVKISTEKAAEAAGEVTVTLGTVQTAKKVTE
jgi:RHS repeat-associated protein